MNKSKANIKDIIKLFGVIKRKPIIYIGALLISASANAIFTVIIAFVNKELINSVYAGKINHLTNIIIATIAAFFFICIIFPIFIYIKVYVIRNNITELRVNSFSHITKLKMKHIDQNGLGDLLSRLNGDIDTLSDALDNKMQVVAVSLIGGISSAVSMLFLNLELFIVVLIVGFISAGCNILFASSFKYINEKIRQCISKMNECVVDMLGGIRDIKLFNLYEDLDTHFCDTVGELKDYSIRLGLRSAQLESINYIGGVINYIGVFAIGALMVYSGRINFGIVVAIITLQNNLNFMLLNFGNFFAQLQVSVAGSLRLIELFELDEENEKISDINNASYKNIIEFNHVDFGYNDNSTILKNVSFSLKKGESLAIVGPSGSGKSSIINILLGFYNISHGSINVGGNNINDYSVSDLRNLFSYVSQESILFDGTIEDNIKMGKKSASFQDVRDAAKEANVDDFIMNLPDGYNTFVGENGNKLSGGQRQRIALARAALKDSKVIILDEATSALDADNQALVQEYIDKVKQKRSVVVIAHKLKTIENFSNIILINNGQIAESGNHKQLLTNKNHYYNMYNAQFTEV